MQVYYFLFSSLIFLFSLGHLARISFLMQEVNAYMYEIVLGLIVLMLFFRYNLKPFKSRKGVVLPILIFVSYLALSYLLSIARFSSEQNIVGLLYLLRLVVYLVFLVYFSFFIHEKKANKKLILFFDVIVLIFFVWTAVLSLLQYFLYPDIRNLLYAGWDPHLNRMVGVFLEPPISGAIYGLLFFFFMIRSKANNVLKLGSVVILFILILLTYSRGTYIGYLVTLSVILISHLKVKKIYLLSIFIIFLAALFAVTKIPGEGAHLTRISTVESRIANYEEAVRIWAYNPLFGVGYNHIRYVRDVKMQAAEVFDASHAESGFHSSFLIILVSGGVIGLALFVYLLYKAAQVSEYSKYAVLFLSLASLTDNVILHPFVLFFFIFLLVLSSIHLSDRSR